MLSKDNTKKARSLVIALCGLVLLALTGSTASAAQNCKKISGHFTLQAVTGPGCTSPIGICTAGSYKGDLSATSAFTGTSLIPTADSPTTSVFLLTGDNAFETRDGNLFTKDAIVIKTTGAMEFAEVDVLVGGSGGWAGATGTLEATGTYSTSGSGEGEYTGEVCYP